MLIVIFVELLMNVDGCCRGNRGGDVGACKISLANYLEGAGNWS